MLIVNNQYLLTNLVSSNHCCFAHSLLRSSSRRILPLMVLGRLSTNSTYDKKQQIRTIIIFSGVLEYSLRVDFAIVISHRIISEARYRISPGLFTGDTTRAMLLLVDLFDDFVLSTR